MPAECEQRVSWSSQRACSSKHLRGFSSGLARAETRGLREAKDNNMLWVGVGLPGWDVHRYADRVNFGKSYYKIHEEMDWPYKILGKDHRRFFHDPLNALIIAERCYPSDPKAVEAAYLHILLDQLCSENPEYKKMLEKLALLDKRKKPRKKKKKEPTSAVEKRFLKDLKKVAELKKLWRAIYSYG